MRMLKPVLVLLVLASLVGATAAVATAATSTSTTNAAATMMPVKSPSKMIDLSQMKSNIGGIYQKLKTGVKTPSMAESAQSAAVQHTASQITDSAFSQIAQGRSSGAAALGIPAPQTMGQLGSLPQISNTHATKGTVPGSNLMIALDFQ